MTTETTQQPNGQTLDHDLDYLNEFKEQAIENFNKKDEETKQREWKEGQQITILLDLLAEKCGLDHLQGWQELIKAYHEKIETYMVIQNRWNKPELL